MQRTLLKIAAIVLLANLAAYGQSLGEVARENREKNAADASAPPPKVITNKDLPQDPNAETNPPSAEADAQRPAPPPPVDNRSAQQRLAAQRAAEQWKRQILAQKNKVANLQGRIEQLRASIQSANGSTQYEGPANRYQARQLQRVAQIQQQLDEQQRKLEQMQEAARHAGMHTIVYDP